MTNVLMMKGVFFKIFPVAPPTCTISEIMATKGKRKKMKK
jgi:hypothetical protein